jgi:hypothetical protein
MRRVSLVVSLLAAGVFVGHVLPHFLLHSFGSCRSRADRSPRHHFIVAAPAPAEPLAALDSEPAPPLVVPTCRLQPPLTEADREPMLAALRQLIAREAHRYPYLADDGQKVLRSFETCGVRVHERSGYILVESAFGGEWLGARFRRTSHGWIAMSLDGGDIR